MSNDFEMLAHVLGDEWQVMTEKYWQAQFLIGLLSDTPANQWLHEVRVGKRKAMNSTGAR